MRRGSGCIPISTYDIDPHPRSRPSPPRDTALTTNVPDEPSRDTALATIVLPELPILTNSIAQHRSVTIFGNEFQKTRLVRASSGRWGLNSYVTVLYIEIGREPGIVNKI